MRKEIENWWKQGKNDLEKANVLFKSKNYDGVAFFCQQAVEKSLKALILLKSKDKETLGHSLIYLSTKAKVPTQFLTGLKKLSPQYFISRYPDVTEDVPYELYNMEMVEDFLKTAKGVIEWIEKQLKL